MKLLGYAEQDVIVLMTRKEFKALKEAALKEAGADVAKEIVKVNDEIKEGDWNR